MPEVDAGDLIAPLSAVLDRLQGKISIEDAEALVAAFAGERVQQVEPGDLITARVFNQVFVDLDDLRRRMALLEGSTTAPTLLRHEPAGTVPLGATVTLLGTGFDPFDTANPVTVQFGDLTISTFILGSKAGQVLFQVPTTLTDLSRPFTTRVTSGTRISNPLQISVRESDPIPQAGFVNVELVRTTVVPAGNIVAGSQVTYVYSVDSRTVRPADYTFDVVFSQVTGADEAAWAGGVTITPPSARIGRDRPQEVTVAVTVPAAALSARVQFVAATADTVTVQDPPAIPITVGQASQAPDPRVEIEIDPGADNPLVDIVVGGVGTRGVDIPGGQFRDVVFRLRGRTTAEGSGAGTYDLAADQLPAGVTALAVPVSDTVAADGPYRQIALRLTAAAGASLGAAVTRLVARHRGTDGTPDFQGFAELAVRISS